MKHCFSNAFSLGAAIMAASEVVQGCGNCGSTTSDDSILRKIAGYQMLDNA